MPDTIASPIAALRPTAPGGPGSTPHRGPIEHRTTGCMSKHWRTPAEAASSGRPTPIATWRRCPADRIRWGRWSTPAAPAPGTRAGW
jgi:hypothetical protein